MKIVHTAPYFLPHVGGVESHVDSVASELASRGHEVVVLSSRIPPDAEPLERFHGYEIRRIPPLAEIWRTPIFALQRVLDKVNPDLVHSHSPPPLTSFESSRWTQRRGRPFVLTHHCDLELPFVGSSLVVSLYESTIGEATVRSSQALIATTESYARTSRLLWNRRVHVVPNPVDTERFSPSVPPTRIRSKLGLEKEFVVLFVGRLVPHKGVEDLLRSSLHTPKDVHYVLVGEGPLRGRLQRIATSLDPSRIHWAPHVGFEELPEWYSASDVVVLPSTSRLEAFGIVALEALASGKPVVATRIPGVSEVVGRGEVGILVEPMDPRGLAQAIERVREDPQRARRWGDNGRRLALEVFDTRRVTDKLEHIYEEAQGALQEEGVPPRGKGSSGSSLGGVGGRGR